MNPSKSDEAIKIASEYNSSFLGTIPYDKSITEAQMKEMSIVEYTDNEVTRQIKKIWDKIKADCF